MILHVTFSHASNPWVFYGDRHQVAKHWRRWIKYHPGTAYPQAYTGNGSIYRDNHGFYILERVGYNSVAYKTLGHALAALERLGGDRP